MIKVPQLTDEEVQTLQVDAILRILGLITQRMSELRAELISANNRYYEAKRDLENLKNELKNLVELSRTYKVIAQSA